MRSSLFKPTVGAISVAATLFALTTTKADTIYDLTTSNLSGLTGPFGSVDVHLVDSTHATVTFTSNVVNGNIYLFASNSALDVNVNATSWTISNFSGSNSGSGFSGPSSSDGGSGNVNGDGTFNENVNNFDGFMHAVSTESFLLTDTSGTWASSASVLKANSNGNTVAAHIFVTTFPANQSNGASSTGFAAGGTPRSVPDGGSTITLLGFALVGVRAARRFINI